QQLQRSRPRGGVCCGEIASRQLIEYFLSPPRQVSIVLPYLETHGLNDLVQPRNDCRIGDAQLLFDIFDLASTANEHLDELQLFASEPRQAPEREVALQRRAAGGALQAHDAQVVTADGAAGQNLVGS